MRFAYDLQEASALIDEMALSRHAGHLLNEVLWRNNISAADVRQNGVPFYTFRDVAKRVRPDAWSPQIAEEIRLAFGRLGSLRGNWPLPQPYEAPPHPMFYS